MRKVSELVATGQLATLRDKAKRRTGLMEAIKANLPESIANDHVDYSLDEDGVLTLFAPAGHVRVLGNILPMLNAKLREFGVRIVRLARI